MVGGGHPGDAVPDHDDPLDGGIEREVDRDDDVGVAARRHRDRHRALHAGAARHPVERGVEAEPLERRLLVGRDRRQVIDPGEHAHGVGAAHAHPAAGLDRLLGGLREVEQRHARLGHDARAALLERDLRRLLTGEGGARAAAEPHPSRRRRQPLALEELPLLGERPPQPYHGQAEHDGAQRPGDPVRARRGPPVEEIDRHGAVDGGELGCAGRHERLERQQRPGARGHGERHLRIVLAHGARLGQGEERDHEPGERAGEQLARGAPLAVAVVEVGEEGDLRVEVVAVLRAPQARAAVRVGQGGERRLPVVALDRQHRAQRGAPAALALEQVAAREGGHERSADQRGRRRPGVVEQHRAGEHGGEEERDAGQRRVGAEPGRRRAPAREAEHARDLVGRRERAHVAPQPGRDEPHQRQQRDEQFPPQVQAGVRVGDEQRADGQQEDDRRDAGAAPHGLGDRVSDLGVVGERVDRARGHQLTPSSIRSVR